MLKSCSSGSFSLFITPSKWLIIRTFFQSNQACFLRETLLYCGHFYINKTTVNCDAVYTLLNSYGKQKAIS